MTSLLLEGAFAGYVLATLCYLWFLVQGRPWVWRIGLPLAAVGFSTHTVLMVCLLRQGGAVITGWMPSLVVFSWCLVGLLFTLNVRYRLKALGLVTLLSAAVFLSLADALSPVGQSNPVVPAGPWLSAHIGLAFLGYAAFVLSFLSGVLYLLQAHQLKQGARGVLWERLPNLDSTRRINGRSAIFGALLFGTSLALGGWEARNLWSGVWHWEVKLVLALLTWTAFVAAGMGYGIFRWTGRRSAWCSAIGFALLLLTFFGAHWLGSRHAFL